MARFPFRSILAAAVLIGLGTGATALAGRCDGLGVAGGPKYRGWSEQDSAMTCGLMVVAPQCTPVRYKPIQAIILIDGSRWMLGDPLRTAKAAAKLAVGAFKDGDFLGVISYSSSGSILYPLQALTRERRLPTTAIESISDGSERDLMAGVNRAMEEFDRFKNQDALGRYLFIFTNGNPNRGTTDSANLVRQLGELCATRGITLSTFGYKKERQDFNEDLLMNLAVQSGGRYYFVEEDNPDLGCMAQEAQRASDAAVRQVSVAIETPSGVRLSRVFGGLLQDNRIYLGDMLPGSRRLLLFDLVGRPQKSADFVVTTLSRSNEADYLNRGRSYLDIPLSTGEQDLDPKYAQYILPLEFQAFVLENSSSMIGKRAEFTTLYRNRRYALERMRGQLNSELFDYLLKVFEKYEGTISNGSIEDELMVKRAKYLAIRVFFGQ